MKSKSKMIGILVVAMAFPLALVSYINIKNSIPLPFKCLYTTQYNFSFAGEPVSMDLTQDIRFYPKGVSYFILNGTASTENKKFNVRRTIFLGNESELQGKTFRYDIKRISRQAGDDIPDNLMNELMYEYSIDNNVLQFDIFHVRSRTWLIGGPYSFISLCLRY